jgi:hypothetical protein
VFEASIFNFFKLREEKIKKFFFQIFESINKRIAKMFMKKLSPQDPHAKKEVPVVVFKAKKETKEPAEKVKSETVKTRKADTMPRIEEKKEIVEQKVEAKPEKKEEPKMKVEAEKKEPEVKKFVRPAKGSDESKAWGEMMKAKRAEAKAKKEAEAKTQA